MFSNIDVYLAFYRYCKTPCLSRREKRKNVGYADIGSLTGTTPVMNCPAFVEGMAFNVTGESIHLSELNS